MKPDWATNMILQEEFQKPDPGLPHRAVCCSIYSTSFGVYVEVKSQTLGQGFKRVTVPEWELGLS
jgi:hypothetical protein